MAEEFLSGIGIGLGPELDKGFPVHPGAGRLQIARVQVGETQAAFAVRTSAVQPEVLGASEALIALLQQLAVFRPPHPVFFWTRLAEAGRRLAPGWFLNFVRHTRFGRG